MQLHGNQWIGARCVAAGTVRFRAVDPANAVELEPAFTEATAAEVDEAMALAAAAHPAFEDAGRERRAAFLEGIADELERAGAPLLERAAAETALPMARLESERGRTCGQLRLFARTVREGAFLDLRFEPGDPSRAPLPKPELRSRMRALGPVVVFGASNFPLAFSVAGGDTASALAAGCPVVVKAHPSHPGTSEAVARVVRTALERHALPEGTFSLLHGRSHDVGRWLVEHPQTRAVAFTGSLAGGRALFDLGARRPQPIPVFAEMGSTNPVFALPGKLAGEGDAVARALSNSVAIGVGQFCTCPGLVVVVRGHATTAFARALCQALSQVPEGTLLHAGIRAAFERRLDEVGRVQGVEILMGEPVRGGACAARARVLRTDARTYLAHAALQEEIFGPSTLLVVCNDEEELLALARSLPGQLTATVQASDADRALAARLLPILEQKAGRILWGGYPTGVEVAAPMVHGGPYPATTDSRGTSVGPRALTRFLRPVCYQDWPVELLPADLR